jgi:hypothetical protein
MKKVLLFTIICLFIFSSTAFAKEGEMLTGITLGQFSGLGTTTSYFGASMLYGLMDELDLNVRYESGSSSGLRLSFITVAGDWNIPLNAKTTPFVSFGLDIINGVVPGYFEDSTTGFCYGVGVKHKINQEMAIILEFKGHTATYMGETETASTIGAGFMLSLL